MSRRALLTAAAVTAGLLGCSKSQLYLTDEPAPPLQLQTVSGDQITLPAADRDVLLYFFASW